jgi:hypothetical protein
MYDMTTFTIFVFIFQHMIKTESSILSTIKKMKQVQLSDDVIQYVANKIVSYVAMTVAICMACAWLTLIDHGHIFMFFLLYAWILMTEYRMYNVVKDGMSDLKMQGNCIYFNDILVHDD